jgi:CheY-like chemotaxis protein
MALLRSLGSRKCGSDAGSKMLTSPRSPQSSTRILLVDDNHYGNAGRKTLLEQRGYEVDTTISGEEAMALIERNRYDVVVTDLKMEGMSGTELIARLRAGKTSSALILLSGFASCMGVTEENCGADAVLCKSNKEEEQLCRTVRLLLSRRTPRKPAASEKRLKSSVARTV